MSGELIRADADDDRGSRARMRASHADRDRVVELLQVAAVDGRLTADELDERLGMALTAQTFGALEAVTADLTAELPVPGLEVKEEGRVECHASSVRRDGRWVVPKRLTVQVSQGSLTLDFTEAVITSSSLLIDTDLRAGHLTLVTKPGLTIDTDDLITTASYVKVRAPWGADVPVSLTIRLVGEANSSHISAGPPRLRFRRRTAHN